jgi:hypothetical protein
VQCFTNFAIKDPVIVPQGAKCFNGKIGKALRSHKTDRFFAASGVQLGQSNGGLFHLRRVASSGTLKAKVGNTLTKVVVLRVNLNIDGSHITSKTHTHPSHSQTSRLLTSSLSLGVPVPRATQCM